MESDGEIRLTYGLGHDNCNFRFGGLKLTFFFGAPGSSLGNSAAASASRHRPSAADLSQAAMPVIYHQPEICRLFYLRDGGARSGFSRGTGGRKSLSSAPVVYYSIPARMLNMMIKTKSSARIMVVDDESIVGQDIKNILEGQGYEVCALSLSGEEALQMARETMPDLVLVDIRLGEDGIDGTQTAARIWDLLRIPVIYLTAYSDEEQLKRAAETSPYGYILKPYNEHELKASIEIALARHGADEVMRKSKEDMERGLATLQAVMDSVSDVIVRIDADYRITMMNKAARDQIRESGLEGVDMCYRAWHGRDKPCAGDDHPCPLKDVLERRAPFSVIHNHKDSDGKWSPVEISVSPLFDESGEVIGAIEVGRDISNRLMQEEERRSFAEDHLRQEKERSIVTLAGGMAHDFNNMLTSVIGNAELLKDILEDDKKVQEYVGTIIESASGMAVLTKQLLAYARSDICRPEQLSANLVVSEALAICREGCSESIGVTVSLPGKPWHIYADRDQIHQMLGNLIRNAVEAMNDKGGRLGLAVRNVVKAETWKCLLRHTHPAGDYVHIEVRDTGPGIPRQELSNIFEPFFTTRFLGRGLGLPAALGIVQNHGGCLSVESEPGQGAAFHVFLPRYEEEQVPEEREESEAELADDYKILVVDDQPAVLVLLHDMLTKRGLNVITAKGGVEALEIFERENGRISLVILDVRMADMDGKRVYRQMKALNRNIPIIVASGFDKDSALGELELAPGDAYMQKPFRMASIINILNELTGTS